MKQLIEAARNITAGSCSRTMCPTRVTQQHTAFDSTAKVPGSSTLHLGVS